MSPVIQRPHVVCRRAKASFFVRGGGRRSGTVSSARVNARKYRCRFKRKTKRRKRTGKIVVKPVKKRRKKKKKRTNPRTCRLSTVKTWRGMEKTKDAPTTRSITTRPRAPDGTDPKNGRRTVTGQTWRGGWGNIYIFLSLLLSNQVGPVRTCGQHYSADPAADIVATIARDQLAVTCRHCATVTWDAAKTACARDEWQITFLRPAPSLSSRRLSRYTVSRHPPPSPSHVCMCTTCSRL